MASLSSHCTQGHLLPGEPSGTISSNTNGAYFAPGSNANPDGDRRVVILLTDAYGLASPNAKIMADQFAKRIGCDVYVPDMFNGYPIAQIKQIKYTLDTPGAKMSFWQTLGYWWTTVQGLPRYIASRPSVTDARVQAFVSWLKGTGKYDSLGVVGYCWGGGAACRLAGRGLINTAMMAHPSSVSRAEINSIKVPTSWICAEEDEWFPRPYRVECEAILAGKEEGAPSRPFEFRDYKGVIHGFAVRPNLDIPEVKTAFDGAFEQVVEWFSKTL